MSDIEHEQRDGEAPQASAPIDPAAAAFERLREEVALARRAVAGLAAERAAIDIPDYSETLAQILQANAATAKRLKDLSETPTLQMSAKNWGYEIEAAAETARRADQHALSQARAAFQDTTERLRGWLHSAQDADLQNTWLKAAGAVGLVFGVVLGLVIASWLSPSAPAKQGSPEQQAAAILHMTEAKAGEHLIQTASPTLWNDLVLGGRIVITNRKILNRCRHSARMRPERCVITLPADQP